MNQPHTLQIIEKSDERTHFCYSVRRPFTASIWRKKKELQTYRGSKVIHKRKCECGYALKREWAYCPMCRLQTTKPTFTKRKVWGSWDKLKEKQVRSRKRARQIAQRWYEQATHRKLRAVKVKFD